MTVNTERMKLRPITEGDFDDIAAIMRGQGVQRVWEHWFSDDDVRGWIERRRAGYEKNGVDYLLAVDKMTGRTVGQIGLLREDFGQGEKWALGWILRDDCTGMGYATEGARALVKYAFKVLEADSVWADIRPMNRPSRAVAGRLGMKRVGSYMKTVNGAPMEHDIYVLENRK